MKMNKVHSAEEARDKAIDWQSWQAEQSMSWGELAEWQGYFTELTEQYPELREEFTENGII